MTASSSEAVRRRRNISLTVIVLVVLIVLMLLFGMAAAGNFTGFQSMTPSPESLAAPIIIL